MYCIICRVCVCVCLFLEHPPNDVIINISSDEEGSCIVIIIIIIISHFNSKIVWHSFRALRLKVWN